VSRALIDRLLTTNNPCWRWSASVLSSRIIKWWAPTTTICYYSSTAKEYCTECVKCSGGASAVKEPGHFEVRTSSSQVARMHFFPQKKLTTFFSRRLVALKTQRPLTPLRLFHCQNTVHTITEAKQDNRQGKARAGARRWIFQPGHLTWRALASFLWNVMTEAPYWHMKKQLLQEQWETAYRRRGESDLDTRVRIWSWTYADPDYLPNSTGISLSDDIFVIKFWCRFDHSVRKYKPCFITQCWRILQIFSDSDPEAVDWQNLINSLLCTDTFCGKIFAKIRLVVFRKIAKTDRQTDGQTNKQTPGIK